MKRDLLPVAENYLRDEFRFKPGDRLHRLVARLCDTYYDDLSEENILKLEHLADTWRITHADGSRMIPANHSHMDAMRNGGE